MTEQTTETSAPAQSVNGRGPVPEDTDLAPDTGEKWLGVLVIAAGCFLLIVGIDRVTGGKLTASLAGQDASGE